MNAGRFAWHALPWQLAHRALDRGAHALLIAGAAGLGKGQFATDLAAAYLCVARRTGEGACGKCESCHWLAAGTHPDLALVERPSEDDDADKAPNAAAQARAKPISVDQIRALSTLITISAHRHAGKVVIIRPAEALNAAASNALLKSLEEPPAGVLFLLVSDRPALLLPTVRSRCQTIAMRLNDVDAACAWLRQEGIAEPDLPLALAGGAPLEAAAIAADALWEKRRGFLSAVSKGSAAAVRIAESFRDLPPALVLAWLQKWTYDLVSMRLGARIRYHVDMRSEIESLAGRLDPIRLTRFHRALGNYRRHVNHPLNARLFVEQMLLEYHQALEAGA